MAVITAANAAAQATLSGNMFDDAATGQGLLNFYLRGIADVEHLQNRIAPGASIVIIGAGYIGLEVAAVAARKGKRVTVLEAADRLMARVVPPQRSVSSFGPRSDQS